jgi:hypothetical protein
MVFSAQSMPRRYKQDSQSNESVKQMPTGKNMNTEEEDIGWSFTRQQLAKTQQTEKIEANCTVCELAILL